MRTTSGSLSEHSCLPPLQSSLPDSLPRCEVLCFFAVLSRLRLVGTSLPSSDAEEYRHGTTDPWKSFQAENYPLHQHGASALSCASTSLRSGAPLPFFTNIEEKAVCCASVRAEPELLNCCLHAPPPACPERVPVRCTTDGTCRANAELQPTSVEQKLDHVEKGPKS